MKKTDQLTHEETIDACRRAFIPARYLQAKVSWTEKGAEMRHWVETNAVTAIAAGQGKFLITEDAAIGMDVFYLAARGTLIQGIATKVLHLPALVDIMSSDANRRGWHQELADLDVVFLAGFYVDGYLNPISEEMRYRLEWLLQSWMKEGKSFVFQATKPPQQCVWWSEFFRAQVSDHTGIPITVCR